MTLHARHGAELLLPPILAIAVLLSCPRMASAEPGEALAALAPETPSISAEALESRTKQDIARAWSKFHEAERYQPSAAKAAAYREVEHIVDPLVKAGSKNADAYFLRFASRGRRLQNGNPLLSLTKLPGLSRDLDHALELDPDHSDALAAKGGLLLGLPVLLGGDAKKALGYLERAIELNPRGPGTRLEYARALIRLKRTDQAYEQLHLAGHYACILRRTAQLTQTSEMLAELQPKIDKVRSAP